MDCQAESSSHLGDSPSTASSTSNLHSVWLNNISAAEFLAKQDGNVTTKQIKWSFINTIYAKIYAKNIEMTFKGHSESSAMVPDHTTL